MPEATSRASEARMTLGITESVCPDCRRVVPAKVTSDEQDVFLARFCPEHGPSRGLIWRGVETYVAAQRYAQAALQPREFAGRASLPCPEGCGFCERHEQHLCLPIIEITSNCNLVCPICMVEAGPRADMSVGEFGAVLDGLLRAEGRVDVLNLSGGEPLCQPRILDLLDEALVRREILRVSVSTNGLRLLEEPSLLEELRARNVVVSLQFDGFEDSVYEALRGRPLLDEKLGILALLRETGISRSSLCASPDARGRRPGVGIG